MSAMTLMDRGLLPDWLIRTGIRRLLRARLRKEDQGSEAANRARFERYVERLRSAPLAVAVDDANEQHYEVPARFFEHVMGKHLKYSCGLWNDGVTDLDEAEAAMLALTVERGRLEDGMKVLDLGCGWGSLSLWIGRHFPNCEVLAISNSHSQRVFIEGRCRAAGITNVTVETRDVNDFETTRRFDRVFSVEMFEHVRNYEELLRRIGTWLEPDGKLFVHVFAHRTFAYPFETDGAANWMGRNFFTGGQMPSADLLPRFQDDLRLVEQWAVNGTHYAKTARAWLENLDARRADALDALGARRDASEAAVALRRWRVFLMACEELWAFRRGTEWLVCHYLFEKP